jgi:hypothetical protein
MSRRHSFASILMACLLAVGLLGIAPVPNAASAGLSILKPGASAGSDVFRIKHRGRGRPLHLPIGPNYLAYDYPYYYRRGFYPKHIGHGYVYFGSPYAYYRKIYRSRCSYRQRRCLANSRHRRGPRRQRGACRCR